MHNHLSIGLALELEPLCFKLLPELGIVLDDAVVDNGELVIIAHVGVGIGENYFASDVTALVAYTKNVIYLEDGEIADITPDRITVYDSIGKNLEK